MGEITAEALRQRLEKGERLSVLDVRSAGLFAMWTLPGALHCDLAQVDTFDPLARDRPVVVLASDDRTAGAAAQTLRERGFDAHTLAGGFAAWADRAWNVAEVALPLARARIVQVRQTGTGCLSYLIGSAGEAAVVDPSLEPARYLDLARERGWTLRHVVETHTHSDHVSRARELADAASAKLATLAEDGASLRVGETDLTAIRTPGHTPDSVCFLVEKRALLTGDTLYLDTVGQPEFRGAAPAQARTRALALRTSLDRIFAFAPDTLVLPGHSDKAVPFDRRPLVGTLRQTRDRVPLLSLPRDEFVERILDRAPR